jgi:toxin CptA
MHAAPSVKYPVGRSAFAALLGALVAVAAFATAALWAAASAGFGWRQALAFAAAMACTAWACVAWLRSPAGVLCWDGLAWTWQGPRSSDAGRPQVALDLQSRLLLQWRSDGGGKRWFWLARASDSAHWEALRRAVYSRASDPILSFPAPGKQSPSAGEAPTAEQ